MIASPPSIEEIVLRVPGWRGQSIAIQPLTNGLTNTNFRVEVDGTPFLVRIPGASTELLAVDRRNEYHNALIAARIGVGPRVVHYLPGPHVMVLEFVEGRTLTSAELRAPGMPSRIARTLRLLHGGPRFLRDVDMFRLVDFYLEVIERRRIPIPASYHARLPTIRRIEAALAARPLPTVPCHNDLVADNLIDDGRSLRLVDFEYSGNNDPTFELGNACRELDYDEPRVAELCAACFGAATPELIARIQLHTIVSDAGWTLWAAIQAKVSRIPFDFGGYGLARWARAEAQMAAPAFPGWLATVQQAR